MNTTRLILAGLLVLAGCNMVDPQVCTEEFAIHTVEVRMPDGMLAQGVDVKVYDARTNHRIEVCDGGLCAGMGIIEEYFIYHDGLLAETSALGRDVVVRGRKGYLSFRADYRFRNNGCHVDKVSGPDVVTLAPG